MRLRHFGSRVSRAFLLVRIPRGELISPHPVIHGERFAVQSGRKKVVRLLMGEGDSLAIDNGSIGDLVTGNMGVDIEN